jgi:transposase
MPRGGVVKRYPEDFKQSAIEMAMQGDQSILQIAHDLGVNAKTLYNWVNQYKKSHGLIKEKAETSDGDLEAEIKRLKKENAKLKMERDILKKATAYFAKETM